MTYKVNTEAYTVCNFLTQRTAIEMRHVGLKERRDVETRSERERLKQSQREREREGETEKQPLGVYFSLRVPQTANTLQ